MGGGFTLYEGPSEATGLSVRGVAVSEALGSERCACLKRANSALLASSCLARAAAVSKLNFGALGSVRLLPVEGADGAALSSWNRDLNAWLALEL
jgi:hypothetical protein